jgi:hypothetical protein
MWKDASSWLAIEPPLTSGPAKSEGPHEFFEEDL